MGSPSSFGRKRPFISLNSSASIGNLSSSERARARARANHAKNDAQKGCAMQLNGITLTLLCFLVRPEKHPLLLTGILIPDKKMTRISYCNTTRDRVRKRPQEKNTELRIKMHRSRT